MTLEDVAHIFGLPIDGEPVSGWTDSSSNFLQSQSIVIFGREAEVSHSSKSYIKQKSVILRSGVIRNGPQRGYRRP
ncbi:hypothetical protein AHAS_Ahas19G0113000 [Arachis hypogaea]